VKERKGKGVKEWRRGHRTGLNLTHFNFWTSAAIMKGKLNAQLGKDSAQDHQLARFAGWIKEKSHIMEHWSVWRLEYLQLWCVMCWYVTKRGVTLVVRTAVRTHPKSCCFWRPFGRASERPSKRPSKTPTVRPSGRPFGQLSGMPLWPPPSAHASRRSRVERRK